MDFSKIIKSKWGVVGVFGGLAALVAAEVTPHDDTQVQALATGAAALVGAGLGVVVKKLAEWGLGKFGGAPKPPQA